MRLRTLLTSAAATVAVAAFGAAAAAAPVHAAGNTVLAVDITGIHVVDWTYRTAGYPDECKAWEKGAGTQTLGIRTPKPVRYELLDIGVGKLLAPAGTHRFAGSAQRTGEYDEHLVPMTSACTPCGPLSEYGECDDSPQDLLAPLWNCERQTPKAHAMLQLVPAGTELEGGVVTLADTLIVSTSIPASWKRCPPEFDGSPMSLHSDSPLEVRIHGAPVRKLMGLRRGQNVTLKGSTELGFDGADEREGCKEPGGKGPYAECAVTDVTVEVRRVR